MPEKKDRFYWDGKQFVPSGTTVLERPYLAQWAANCAIQYIEDNDISTEPNSLRMVSGSTLLEARTAFLRESEKAADYGTYIHTLCKYSLEHDILIESPDEMTNAFMKGFRRWVKKHEVKPIAMEQEVIGDGYGGRLDLVCELDGVVTLVDYKTAKQDAYWPNWKYQIAGYRAAYNTLVCIKALRHAAGIDDDKANFSIILDEKNKKTCNEYRNKHFVKAHGILKFNKETWSVSYKDFTEYSATRTNPETKKKEKYTRTYETDRDVFNALVKLWWYKKRGILWK